MRVKKNDFHIHTEFSADSNLKLEQLIAKAKQLNYSIIAITEHFDLTPSELFNWGLPSLNRYQKFVQKFKNETSNLQILCGLELGELHRCSELATSILNHYKPDITIGSVHVLPDETNLSIKFDFDLTEELIISYYAENLKLVKHGGFDILGHLGVYKRYLQAEPDETCAEKMIEETLKTIIQKEIALEVNYSGLSKPLKDIVPNQKVLKLYKKLGGKLITLGSDAHSLTAFDLNRDTAIKKVKKAGFMQSAYKKNGVWHLSDLV